MGIFVWVGFIAFILSMLALDLGVLNRKAHIISTREALKWTALWVSLSLGFSILVYGMYEHHWFGAGVHSAATVAPSTTSPSTASPDQEHHGTVAHGSGSNTLGGKDAFYQYLTGYIVEQSLSLDNVMVIALIFAYFGIPRELQHRVLFWGIVGVLVMRGLMIAAGTALIERFDWITYVFGGLLLLTAVKLLLARNEDVHPERNPLVRVARMLYPVTQTLDGEKFFTRVDGRRAITPLFLVLLVVESTDVLFAVDSIPAVFAVTKDPFIVFTSNVFAILGLRSLYFALAGLMAKFQYLTVSLVFVLAFVGIKLILEHHYHIPVVASLVVIVGILSVGVLASLLSKKARNAAADGGIGG